MNIEVVFPNIQEEVYKIIYEQVCKNLQNKEYNHKESRNWSNAIVQKGIQALLKFNKNFKYLLHCFIMQKEACCLSTSRSVFWDSEIDGGSTITWENDSILCIVSLYALGL